MEFSYGLPAGENGAFTPGCFDESVGKKKPFKYQLKNQPLREVESTVEKVEISEDGKEATFTISILNDVFKEIFGAQRASYDSFSFINTEPSDRMFNKED